MYDYDAGCQGGMKNQSVARQQNLYGLEHSLANKIIDITLLNSFKKDLLPCSQKCPLPVDDTLCLSEKVIFE